MPTSPPSPQRVLVIDDDATMRDLLSLILGMEGHAVQLADSGESALDILASLPPSEHPTVILTDLQMPGLIGARLAARLRTASPQAQIIAMSGTKPATAKLRAYDAFLQKPFTAADFTAALSSPTPSSSSLLSSRTLSAEKGEEPASVAATLPALDEAVYAKLTTSMPPPQLKELYAMCLTDAETRITHMKQAAVRGDATTFSKEAHAIKGGCGMLGARELHDLASRMETGALLCTSLLNDFPHAAARLRRILDART